MGLLTFVSGRGPGRFIQTPRCEGWDVWQPHRETQVFAYGHKEDLLWVGLVVCAENEDSLTRAHYRNWLRDYSQVWNILHEHI